MDTTGRYDRLARHYKWVTWFGILLNSLFIFPLLLFPRFTLDLLGIELDQLIFARTAGMLLLWISVFYIPASLDLKKYRVHAWLAVFPSRTGGATFFFELPVTEPAARLSNVSTKKGSSKPDDRPPLLPRPVSPGV